MASSLSNLGNNLSEVIHKIKCEQGDDDKKYENYEIKYEYCNCSLENKSFKDNLIEHKCLCCHKNYQQKFDERLKERFLIHINFLTMIKIVLF